MINLLSLYPLYFSLILSVGVGFLFPVGVILFLLVQSQASLSLAEIVQLHRDQPLLAVIWNAPLVLGGFGYALGRAIRSLKKQHQISTMQQAEFQTIFDTVASAIISIDQNGLIKTFNKAAETMFGFTCAEVEGQNVKILMPEAVAAQHDAFLENYRLNRHPKILGKQREIEARRKNGEIFSAILKVNEMDLQGEIFFTGVIDDVSEAKTLQIQLNQSQKMEAIGQLASGIAHEINTPVQYIGDNLHALLDNFNDLNALLSLCKDQFEQGSAQMKQQWDDWAEQFDLEFIQQDIPAAIQQSIDGVEKVAEIVKAMKAFSHANDQNAVIANLNEIISNTLIIAKNEYKYFADIETNLADDLPAIECYPGELNQVLLNLIVNAAHAIDEKKAGRGRIKITTFKNSDRVCVTIQDNGAGIPKAIQDKVFNLFFTTKEVGKGTGQGLSLAHKIIVKKHQGQFYFDSEEGIGTSFHIKLPIVLNVHSEAKS